MVMVGNSLYRSMILPIVLLVVAQMHAATAFHVPPSRAAVLLQTRSIVSTQQPQQHTSSSSAVVPSAASLNRDRSIVPSIHTRTSSSPIILRGLFDDDDEDDPEIIPPELRDEIYRAEANTPAAQGRQQRIIVYLLLTFAGVTTSFFNAFLTDLRFGDGSPSTDVAFYGFGWVQDNWFTSFMFLNKIGGAIGLLGAGLSGTLAEVEVRSRKENAEKIFTEMQRRKSLKENKASNKANKKKKKRSLAQTSKKDMTGTQKKRLSALEELMEDETPAVVVPENVEQSGEVVDSAKATITEKTEEESKEDGIFGKIKGFYNQADSMAASQALLLNKELEDRGVVDKITDESGLKVIGKEAAAKAAALQDEEE
mmetsp:Transcript_33281/g.59950  ORF Transcript_33281/g.59950 Transcript_33281/m.59950 type:complete len:368 (-) Transcript_33281:146-1249(-)|eukprot:CAMPEP_0201926778 /NCGR_PEP_ID=MMETSP0903-20130614/16952_1 /ASSEMBLY_ACC=CAM_ASM_000552 /TAXON_ID=420261 /ORGANISM="Thalassiosira antarctica, Strain CCMP982" /LENGTH=367 /DNA_ID=CAMNT_0048464745 /DNA_START=37 /DNA_END=1140 /DNA_ORIENTATION=-